MPPSLTVDRLVYSGGENMGLGKKLKKWAGDIGDEFENLGQELGVDTALDATSDFFDNPVKWAASTFLPDKGEDFARDPGGTLQRAFAPDMGEREMRRANDLAERSMRENRTPTVDDARRAQDVARLAKSRRGRASAMLGASSSGSSTYRPSAGSATRSLLG